MYIEVQVGSRIESFCNIESAKNFARTHGGIVLNTANVAIDGIAQSDSFPTPSPGLCSLLGLSTVALREPEEIRAAWEANGKKSTPRDREKIVSGLVSYFRTKRGTDADSTLKFLSERHPLLFSDRLRATAGTSSVA